MNLRTIVAGATLVVATMLGASAGLAQSSLARILADGVIRVGTTGDFNPMTMRDVANDSYAGFEIDAANRLAEDLGVTLEIVPTDWKTMVAGVLADKYDVVMSGTSISAGRARVVGYTRPYLFAGTVPMALKTNGERFETWDDANQEGVRVAVILGTVFEQQARAAFPNATVVTVEAPATGYQEVLAGRADVTITSNVDAASLMEKFDAITTFAEGAARDRRPFAYIVGQENQTLMNFLNSWIELQEAAGFFEELETRWGL